ncbi:MAG: hypothetical protein IMW93_01135 [Thermoanaerobacteraceae bacterium]|nr:hypothetical protein [Desulfofundulus thermobenzoicus]MBE3587161.1 hypothetical protein [Thermoanaerobacteraceae bacterium]HHW44959.1 hypothetical protein [Desulfotomaculum sp.]
MIDWTLFYVGMAIVGAVGILAAIFKKPVDRIMEQVEEKACGRNPY